jgi:hypothetical protein
MAKQPFNGFGRDVDLPKFEGVQEMQSLQIWWNINFAKNQLQYFY